jgi:hypothetical protein
MRIDMSGRHVAFRSERIWRFLPLTALISLIRLAWISGISG